MLSVVLTLAAVMTMSGSTVSAAESSTQTFEKMELEVGVEVTGTRSWTKGTSAGVSYGIAPGNFETLAVYIPAVRTAGRLKYKVYMDGYPQNTFYDYLTVTESYAPCKNSVHYKTIKVKKAGLDY